MDYRLLLKNVERTLEAIAGGEDVLATVVQVGEAIVRNFRNELGILGGRLYVRRENQYVLERGFGRSRRVPSGISVSADYGPIRRAEEDGLALTDLDDPSVDREFERRLGVTRFAAVSFGGERYLLSFDVHPRARAEDLLLALGIIRTVVDSKVRTERLEGLMQDARRIQQSILPRAVPRVGDFEVYGLSLPAEAVGGDFYDFLPLGDLSFGAAIADASGHGLLAALLVRDIYVGLRMGIGSDFKIARTIERLNRILNKSRLTTKFVSLFYGEFETNGDVVYVNAGHPPPLHLHAASGAFSELMSTGMVLGPAPDAVYTRRAIHMERGDVVLLYTDGVVEAHDPKGREFGAARLKRLVAQARRESAREIVQRVVNVVRSWSHGAPAEDDVTAVAIRRDPRRLAEPARVRPGAPAGGTTPPSG
ncbi:MAG TPA: PP2C family protein-serine/threonine phosphatase [Thermoanaerobaculia bacterium]|nr:PP2C family protein-serine/threonine phosphatase [Thermoanaerobaculia bacterium]